MISKSYHGTNIKISVTLSAVFFFFFFFNVHVMVLRSVYFFESSRRAFVKIRDLNLFSKSVMIV